MAEVTTGTVHIAHGETRTLNARVQDSTGIILTSATFQLMQADGVTPSGAQALATVAIAGPAPEVKATYVLDTSALVKGAFSGKFVLTTSDGEEIIYIPLIVGLYSDPPYAGAYGATIFTGEELPDSGTMVGNTLMLRRRETGDMPFSIPTASVSVLMPSGDAVEGVTATVMPKGPAISYVISALVEEAVAGDYEAAWTIVANGQTLLRRETHFSFWTDVRSQVRRLLRVDAKTVSDLDVDLAARSALATLMGVDNFGPYIDGYSSVAVRERSVFDQALALVLASWMRPFTPKQGALGELIGLAIGPDEYRWSPTSRPQDTDSVEEAWLDSAMGLFSSMPSLSGAFSWQRGSVGFVASGRRRTVSGITCMGDYGSENPLRVAWDNWLSSGSCTPWSW